MYFILSLIIGLLISSSIVFAEEDSSLMLEAGYVWQDRNDFKISPSTGTLVRVNELDRGPFAHYRVEYTQNISGKHSIRFVYAPFEVNIEGQLNEDVQFNGSNFSNSSPIKFKYKFNSYRVGYVYNYYSDSTQMFRVGFTGKVRDALISLKQSSTDSAYDNIGFVPLLYLSYQKSYNSNWSFYSDLDVSAAPQGRAVDLTAKIRRKLSKSSSLGLGYRTIEGGADNDKVFSFSWFNYAILDFNIGF